MSSDRSQVGGIEGSDEPVHSDQHAVVGADPQEVPVGGRGLALSRAAQGFGS